MYDIDLLKGRYRPIRSKPILAILLGLRIILPLLLFVVLFIHYDAKTTELRFVNKLGSTITKRISEIDYEADISKAILKKLKIDRKMFNEIATGADRYGKWTPKLREIVNKLPPSLAISEFDVNKSSKKIREPIKDEPGKYEEHETVSRTLRMRLFSIHGETQDQVVYEYLNELRNSEVFDADKDTLRIVTFTTEEFSGIELPCYIIQCSYHAGYDEEANKPVAKGEEK